MSPVERATLRRARLRHCPHRDRGVVCGFHWLIAGAHLFPEIAEILFEPPNEPFEIQRRFEVNEQAASDYVGSWLDGIAITVLVSLAVALQAQQDPAQVEDKVDDILAQVSSAKKTSMIKCDAYCAELFHITLSMIRR